MPTTAQSRRGGERLARVDKLVGAATTRGCRLAPFHAEIGCPLIEEY